MPTFEYKSRDGFGKLVYGTCESSSVDDVVKRLVASGLYPSAIKRSLLRSAFNYFQRLPVFQKTVSIDEKIDFASRLATLLKAGIPLGLSLDSVIEQTGAGRLKEILVDIKKLLDEGMPLSGSMARHKSVFAEVHIAIVEAGEYSGFLDTCLESLALMLEREKNAREKARDVSRYPKIVLFGMTLACIALVGFILPRYEAIFERMNTPLPLPTEILMELGGLARRFWFVGAGAFAVAWFIFRFLIHTDKGRLAFDKFLYKIPIIGEVFLFVSVSGWADALGNLLRSGVPIIRSLTMSAKASGNAHFAGMVKNVSLEVAEGSGLSGPLRSFGLAPAPAPQMIAAGEASGSLDSMLFSVRDYFGKEADKKIKRLSAYFEPALIVGLSFVVLFLALSVFLPMWDMTTFAHRR